MQIDTQPFQVRPRPGRLRDQFLEMRPHSASYNLDTLPFPPSYRPVTSSCNGGRSNTCRRCNSPASAPTSAKPSPHASHCFGRCVTSWSASTTISSAFAMTCLPARFLPTLLPQTLRLPPSFISNSTASLSYGYPAPVGLPTLSLVPLAYPPNHAFSLRPLGPSPARSATAHSLLQLLLYLYTDG